MVVTKNYKYIVMSLFFALFLSACGKKKQVLGGTPPTPPPVSDQGTEKQNPPTPPMGKGEEQAPEAQPSPQLPKGPSQENESVPDLPSKDQGQGRRPNPSPRRPVEQTPKKESKPAPQPETPSRMESAEEEKLMLYSSDKNSPAAKEDFSTVEDNRTTGFEEDGLFYSGAGSDEILEYFKNLNNSVTREQKRLNLRMASEIESAQLSVPEEEDQFNEVKLKVKLTSGEQYTLVGANDGQGTIRLRQVRNDSSRSYNINGFVKCVDLNQACENSYARLQFSNGAVARIIFRQSEASTKFGIPTIVDHQGLVYWNAWIVNGINNERSVPTRLRSVTLSTVEVVNGRSSVHVSMKSANSVRVNFQGALMVSEGNSVQVPMRQQFEVEEADLFSSVEDINNTYAKWLSRITMVKNTGRGQMKFALVLNRGKEKKNPVISMVVAHNESDVMTAKEISQFESRLKK